MRDRLGTSDLMNEIERRALLGAAGVGAIAALSRAGPLNPPPGAVAPTSRTLNEVYDKIPAGLPNGTGDGRTPIAGGTISTFISQPGSYVLTGNITTTGSCIVINTDGVTLDLNGFTLASTSLTTANLSISGARTAVTVRNGQIAGGLNGVSVLVSARNLLLEDLSILGAKLSGITVNGAASRAAVIRRCTITDTGASTTPAESGVVIAGIQYLGANAVIQDCTVFRLFSNAQGVTTFRGIGLVLNAQSGSVVERCRVLHDAPITGQGINLNSGASVFRDNTVINFTIPYAIGAGNANGGGNA